MLLGIEVKSIIDEFAKAEKERPSPRKEMKEYTVYASREFDHPSNKSIEGPFPSDFGSTVSADVEHDGDVQPNAYRAPKVYLKTLWSYSINIRNVACLVRSPSSELHN